MGRSRRLLILLSAIAVASGGASFFLLLRPGPLPAISRGAQVPSQCPATTSDDYYYPRGTVHGVVLLRNPARAWYSRLLRAAGEKPLWCGDVREAAYRFMLVFEWGRTKIITAHRSGPRWALDATEFGHARAAPFTIVRRVSRELSTQEVVDVQTAVERDGFWRLRSDERERGCVYDGPEWFLEARSKAGYHHVSRGCDSKDIDDSARALMDIAGMPGVSNSEPPSSPLAYELNVDGVAGAITILNREPFDWTHVVAEIGNVDAPFVCPTPATVPANGRLDIVIGRCQDATGHLAMRAAGVRLNADQGFIQSGIEPAVPAR